MIPITSRSRSRLLVIFILLTISIIGISQSNQSKANKHNSASFFTMEKSRNVQTHQLLAQHLNISSTNLQEKSLVKSESIIHTKYQQFYQGIPVLGGELITHEGVEDKIRVNGNYFPEIDLNISGIITSSYALDIALKHANAHRFIWEMDNSYQLPIPQLMIMDSSYPAFSGEYCIVYAIEVYSTSPLSRNLYYIDAKTGILTMIESLMCTESVPATGESLYLGEVAFVSDSIAPDEYQLIDYSRGNGNATYTFNGEKVLMTDEDNHWDFSHIHNRNAAIDAHYCTAKFYDLLEEYFDYSGLDGEGESMNCVVNYRDKEAYVNAFWDGRFSWFGNGDCTRGPLTSLDVVAHEFTHGLTDYTSDLVYQDEPGSLNEAMSDIFGKALEWYVTPEEFNWLIGDIFILGNSRPFRNMQDPNLESHPKYYKGNFWHTVESDNGGVHTNSGVLNYWFYLITEGGQGINEKGDSFDIQGLGMENALKVPFQMQRAYLLKTSQYEDAYIAATESAKDIFGEDSQEFISVRDAMAAIGLPRENNNPDLLEQDLSIMLVNNSNHTCLKSEMLDLEVRVKNQSSQSITLDQPLQFVINNNLSDIREFEIITAIEPNSEISFVIHDAFLIFVEGEIEVSIELLNEDAISTNNIDHIEIENYFEQSNDVELNIFVPSEIDCYERDIPIEAIIRNSSCEPILAGIAYTIDMMNNAEVINSFSYNLETDVEVGGSVRHTLPFTYPGEITILDFELSIENDPNQTNNYVAFLPVFKSQEINSNYVNAMDSQDDLTRDITLNENNLFGIVEYQGESYLGTTGQFSNFNNLCTFWQDNFISGSTANMEMCVDMADYENVTLQFDLVQMRNNRMEDFPELEYEVTLAKVRWSGPNINEQLVINNQPEGEIVHYEIPLPDNFTGYISFDFYNHIGTLNFGSAVGLENNDFNLLDNLSIKGDFLSHTDDISLPTTQVNIYPNPTKSNITVGSSDIIEAKYEIFALDGQMVTNGFFTMNDQTIHLENLKPGLHIIRIVNQDQKVYSARFLFAP